MPDATPQDLALLRRCFAAAEAARKAGNHPFAALLADETGAVLIEAGNAFGDTHDATAHAERLVATEASRRFGAERLRRCTLVTSAEPCAMCAGATYWAGIGRVVYGLSEHRLKEEIGPHPENLTLDLPCRTVFAAGQREVAVIGPLLEEEALVAHRGFWALP
ncbi:nucleoside deaminase [Acetobacteraceae bacterium H6797]|nr:nucleoside deaminase [Acetobacteraceae bacterium H6797]